MVIADSARGTSHVMLLVRDPPAPPVRGPPVVSATVTSELPKKGLWKLKCQMPFEMVKQGTNPLKSQIIKTQFLAGFDVVRTHSSK